MRTHGAVKVVVTAGLSLAAALATTAAAGPASSGASGHQKSVVQVAKPKEPKVVHLAKPKEPKVSDTTLLA